MLHAHRQLKTFTIANVFRKGQPEHLELGMLVASLEKAPPAQALLHDPLLLLKTDCESALHILGYDFDVAVAGPQHPSAHPGRTAEVLVRPLQKSGGDMASHPFTPVGRIFEVHPAITARFDLPHRAAALLLDLTALLAIAPAPIVAAPVPQFPAVTYDVTLPRRRQTEQVGDLLKRLRGSHQLLETVAVKDLYADNDTYNLTLTFTYRARERTLTEDEVKAVHEKILQDVARE